MKKTLIIAAAIAVMGGCATGPAFEDVVTEAEKEIKAAKSMNFLWRDTEKFLKNAKKAKKEGDDAKAMKLAKKALDQAKMAQQQAKAEAGAKEFYD